MLPVEPGARKRGAVADWMRGRVSVAMLSYQHAYHAGNAADVHKHTGLVALLDLLTRKTRPITVIESHAGRGLYDLSGPEATKTGEAAAGIASVAPSGRYGALLATIRAQHGAEAYPGSPVITAGMLRPGDRHILCELHPAEHAALRTALPDAEIHRRDGHAGLRALTPPKPRRGLALIDPSYEVKDEYQTTAATARMVLRRWPEAVVAIWYPVLPAGRHLGMLDRLGDLALLRDEVAFADPPERGMSGSGLLILNPPWGAADALDAARADVAGLFAPR